MDLSGLYNRFGKAYKQKAIEVQTQMLLDYAPKMLQRAYDERTFKNRTWNLADSYIWVVYYEGAVKGSGYLWNAKVATKNANYKGNSVDGRALAQSFVDSYSPNMNGWSLVFAATTPYASDLENGTATRRKFYVITTIYDEVTSDFKGKAVVKKVI